MFSSKIFIAIFLTCVFFIFHEPIGHGQKVLQVEKRNSAATVKYHIGDILIFKLPGDKDWRYEEIVGIDVKDGIILLGSADDMYTQPIAEIEYILPPHIKSLSNTVFWFFAGFGVPDLVYTLLDWAVRGSYNWLAFYAGVGAIAIAVIGKYAIPWIFKKHIGKKYRLRLLDLTFYPLKE